MSYSRHGANPKITNITFTDGATELSHIFNSNVKQFDISTRNGKSFTFSYEENGTSSNYKTVTAGNGYFETFVKDTLTIYLLVPNATSGSPETIEILEWSSVD